MMKGRSAVFGAFLALPLVFQAGTAGAAPPDRGHYVYVPPGAMVVFLPDPGAISIPRQVMAEPTGFPIERIFVQQRSMMRQIMAGMDQVMAMPWPDPQQMLRSVMEGTPLVGPNSGVIMTSLASGNGSCSETITYGYPANGGQPQVKVTRSGNACAALTSAGPVDATQTAPIPHQATPEPAAPQHGRIWTIGYPPHPVTPARHPRS